MRRLFLLMYLLFFVDEVALLALVPLTPVYTNAFSLSKQEAGALVAAANLSIVIASVPAGIAADRLGARRVTLAGGALLVVACLGQGLAPSFGLMLAARFSFGLASAVLWTAGLSWLADTTSSDRRSTALGAVVAVAGLGGIVGPGFAGVIAEQVSRKAPFVIIGVAAVLVLAALSLSDPGGRARHHQYSLRATLAATAVQPLILGGLVIMMLGGLGDGIVNLLAPLQLDALGVSPAATGLVFSASAAIFMAVSALVARAGQRAVSLLLAGACAAVQAATVLPVVAAASTLAVATLVLGRAPFVAVPYVIAFSLVSIGARRAGVGTATVNGLLGVAWGCSSFLGPLLAGVVAERSGDRPVYAALAVVSMAAAIWMLRAGRRQVV
ncbi:MAG: MFS transporter [Gaiellales bacterium]